LIAVAGPLAGGIFNAVAGLETVMRPELWVVSELPLESAPPPREFLTSVDRAPALWAVEEHVAQGGFGRMLASLVLEQGLRPRQFRHYCAKGYPSGTYGSQEFHRKECGISASQILADVMACRREVGSSHAS
jgi:transketolase